MDLLPLKSVDPQKVYYDNLIIGRQRNGSFFVNGNQLRFIFTHKKNSYKPAYFFKIKLSDHYLWASLENMPPVSALSEDFQDIDINSLPDEIRPVILESACKNLVSAIEDELGITLSLEELQSSPPDSLFNQELQFLVNIDGHNNPIRGRLHMDSPAFEFIATLLERSNFVRKYRFMSVETSLSVVLSIETFSLKEFNTLHAGDIIILKNQSFFEDGNCRVVLGGKLIYSSIFQDGNVTLGSFMDEKIDNENLPDESDELSDDESLEDLDLPSSHTELDEDEELLESESDIEIPSEMGDIPINLVFEVGQKRISLEELQTLKSGYTFELDNPANLPVTIRANGKPIGTGELLKIGEHVGVRVASFK